ncbi:metallophosphoesterase family protein [Lewinella sp. 4G2]|uniref:metallophosphoesterase family protein n=1 Tax=Lewinella sp. 4G2 TaxID=1803372 RepID=UPI0007B46DCB|nr:metallophosphoesterase family protein [Lewinella sp. 4G2]OAV46086.1 hypothetical protein A3850_017640 [Lewinella sp. 4G2]
MPRYAISDIHGCAKTFQLALDRINLQKTDELFLLGDYIDRGPDSLGVLEIIWRLEEEGYLVTCLRGNHEQMLIEYVAGDRPLYGWSPPPELTSKTMDWMNALPYYHETEGYILVHAGLNTRATYPFKDTNAMLWERYWYDYVDYNWLGNRTILHGHTPTRRLEMTKYLANLAENQYLDIDGGCSQQANDMGWLAIFNLDTQAVEFVKMAD